MVKSKRQAAYESLKGGVDRYGGIDKVLSLDKPDLKVFFSGYKCTKEDLETLAYELKGILYFKFCSSKYKTWADVKTNLNLTRAKKFLNLTETDLKEYWRSNKDKPEKERRQKPSAIFTRKEQAFEFYERQPFFYDESGLWWLWAKDKSCYVRKNDDIEILDMISEDLGVDVIRPNEKVEIINALKIVGRKKVPKPINPMWLQFKNEIYDLSTGEISKPNPSYFVTNPIPYRLHQSKYIETPKMDEIFEEWVGKEYIKTLHQIIAYSLLPSYPLNRLFCFIGSGMNGKSKFLELLTKFVGEDNCTSTELDTLLTSRFETARLHKKLVCLMGETNFNEISRTSILKKLTGGDLIGFEYKNKNPFHDKNYSKIIISTNNLPTTTDKSKGFYRRWLIIDFPNEFSEQKDILLDIPEEEYECLARKCCFILKDLLDERRFHNEGTIEDRIEKYEAKSDFLQKFVDDAIIEDVNDFITKSEFFRRFSAWCKENRHRQLSETSLGLKMKEKGYESGKKYLSWLHDGKGGDARTWQSISWKEL